jgi:hypothetical protein
MLDGMKARLGLYERGRPYHASVPAPNPKKTP